MRLSKRHISVLAIGAERWKSSGVVRVALVALTDAEREDFIREDIADFALTWAARHMTPTR